MNRFASWFGAAAAMVLAIGVSAADLSPEQKDAADKLRAKGGLVNPVAANSDALEVSLSNVGKNAGDAELALVKLLPKVEQLNLRGTGVTDKGLANLEGMTTLTTLHLEQTAVTDEGLT